MNEFERIVVFVGAGLVLGFAATSLYLWVRAEIDERRWRRKLQEETAAAIVREHRYGTSKKGKL